MMSPPDVARLAFAEAMLGNFDWCLRFEPGDHMARCYLYSPAIEPQVLPEVPREKERR